MKRVFSNWGEVVHVWAQQNQDEGRSSNCYFEGATIYSYGRHYPLATFVTNKRGQKLVVVNGEGYSKTTCEQIHATVRAVNQYPSIVLCADSHKAWKTESTFNATAFLSFLEAVNAKYQTVENLACRASSLLREAIETHFRRLRDDKRKPATLHKLHANLLEDCKRVRAVLAHLGVNYDREAAGAIKKLSKAFSDTAAAYDAHSERVRRLNEKRNAAAAEAAAIREVRLATLRPEAVAMWMRCEAFPDAHPSHGAALRSSPDILLRYNAARDEIETSWGAFFPLADALVAFECVKRVRGKGWKPSGLQSLRLGNYAINEVTPEGNVRAGCHYVKWEAIEACAALLPELAGACHA